ncbi:MAG: recombinase family protein, partial [Phycisphaerales bacterium]|nr:recombinase family protein [Phycisphaerales bacterium]
NIRKDGRGIVEVDAPAAANVRRIFHLYAYEPLTLDGVVERIRAENLIFRPGMSRFPRSMVYDILKDRAYIGEVEYGGQWYPGKHEPLINRQTWDRVAALLDGGVRQSHQLTYAGEFMTCGHCGHVVTGEHVRKKNKHGYGCYVYYRCSQYLRSGHPRVRVTETALDEQMLALFDRMRIQDDGVREWFRTVLLSQTKDAQTESAARLGRKPCARFFCPGRSVPAKSGT